MVRVIKVSEILKELQLTAGYTERVTNILKSSQEYGEKTKTSILGATVDGEYDEVIKFVDKKLHENTEITLSDTIAGQKKALNHEIKAKKEELSSGDEYYEYKTVLIQDSEFLGRVIGQKLLVVSPNKQDNLTMYGARSKQQHLPTEEWMYCVFQHRAFSGRCQQYSYR